MGQRECMGESQKHKYCLSKYTNKILCIPEERKYVDCITKKVIDVVLNTNNIK